MWEGLNEESEGIPAGTPSPALPAVSSPLDSPIAEPVPEQPRTDSTPRAPSPVEASPDESPADEWTAALGDRPYPAPRLTGQRKGHKPSKPRISSARAASSPHGPDVAPERRLILLDTGRRSGLPAGDFAELDGVSKHTLYAWKKRFEEQGPAGLLDQPRGAKPGSKLPDLTKRAILLMKQSNPDWGCQRISDLLARGPALPASASAVARVLHEAGYQAEDVPTKPHPDHVRRFERATPNQLWQTDLFTFVVGPINDPPTAQILQSEYEAQEQTPLDLHGQLSVGDPDAEQGDMQATLSVTAGVILVDAGATGGEVVNPNTAGVTLVGTLWRSTTYWPAISTRPCDFSSPATCRRRASP